MCDPHSLIPRLRKLLASDDGPPTSAEEKREDNGSSMVVDETVQSLWSGYGRLVRVRLSDEDADRVGSTTIVVKHVRPPPLDASASEDEKFAHQRKLRSYEVESNFYSDESVHYSLRKLNVKVPKLLALSSLENEGSELLLVLEDLNTVGFDRRANRGVLSSEDRASCLRWLARFHAAFLYDSESGDAAVSTCKLSGKVWDRGTYWHLDTRPAELRNMASSPLKTAARALDRALKGARFQTLLHGDAKEANFCFRSLNARSARHSEKRKRSKSKKDKRDRKYSEKMVSSARYSAAGTRSNDAPVAAVDFQYAGNGVGMQDVAYLLEEMTSMKEVEKSVDLYFTELKNALNERRTLSNTAKRTGSLSSNQKEQLLSCSFSDSDIAAIEQEWRTLFPVAMADLTRMWAGWSWPGTHASSQDTLTYSSKVVRKLVEAGIRHVSGE